jgi:hypothetical protein
MVTHRTQELSSDSVYEGICIERRRTYEAQVSRNPVAGMYFTCQIFEEGSIERLTRGRAEAINRENYYLINQTLLSYFYSVLQ